MSSNLPERQAYLTDGPSHAIGLADVRCPGCGHLQFRYRPSQDTLIERKCRCKVLFRIVGGRIVTVLA